MLQPSKNRANGNGQKSRAANGAAKRARGPKIRELPKITNKSDTRDTLAHAAQDARKMQDYFIIDVDAHVTEVAFWAEITERMDSDVYRQWAQSFRERGASTALMNIAPGIAYQDVNGRIPHDHIQLESSAGEKKHRQIVLTERAMNSMGIDYQIVFPTPMLQLGMHPQPDVEIMLGKAYNRWMTETILPQQSRMKMLVYLPFCDPDACIEAIETFGDKPGVLGFCITATRYKPVHHNSYMKLYAAIEETGKPLAFHAGYYWGDPSMMQINRFIGMHAISFVHFSILHVTNWVLNGLPERFPKLKLLWIESGLAWVPFIMQRLDFEFLMRSSEAPLLKRRPSEYIREMFFSSQPLETSNMALTEAHFDAVNAETQLLYSSDWPHWDFNPPNSITNLPFLSKAQKRNILGLNAARFFNLPVPKKKLAEIPEPFAAAGAS